MKHVVGIELDIPTFEPVFDEVRKQSRHLTMKDEATGLPMVDDDEIEYFADELLASDFYVTPWLVGCSPPTVLLEWIIRDLHHADPKRLRKAVNAAFNAETRVLNMSIEDYCLWAYLQRGVRPKGALLTRESEDDFARICLSPEKRKIMPTRLESSVSEAETAHRQGTLNTEWARTVIYAVELWEHVSRAIAE